MQALMGGVPFVAINASTTGAATGTPFAVPFQGVPSVTFLAVPTGSVSAFEYNVFASVDGVTFVQVAAAITAQVDFQSVIPVSAYPILRVDQVSRAGGTSQAVYATLSNF